MVEGYRTSARGQLPGRGLGFDPGFYRQPQRWVVHHRGLEYPGEVIVADKLNADWGQALPGDTSFRLVFYTTPRRIPAGQIRDPRIAMAVPRQAAIKTRGSYDLELNAIREATAHYATGRDPRQDAVRRSMEERAAAVRQEMAHTYAISYAEGRIYTRPEVRIRPADIFAEEGPESWADRLAAALLSQAHPHLPVDYQSFSSVLTSEGAVALFRSLLQGDRVGHDAATRFGPGLGLSRSQDPARFDAAGCRPLAMMASELDSRHGEMSAQEMVAIFGRQHGLPRTLGALYLLAFVRQARAELELRQGHAVRSRGGGHFLSDRITWDLVPEVTFTESTVDEMHTVRRQPAPAWNAVLPYAVLIVPGLKPAREPPEVAPEELRLLEGLKGLERRIEASRRALDETERALGQSAQFAREALHTLEVLSASAGYRGFHSILQEGFDGPPGLQRLLDLQARLERLGELAPEVSRAKIYLGGMTFGAGHEDLALDRDAIAGRIGLDSLLADPTLWRSIHTGYEQLRRHYEDAYLSHHTRYHEDASRLRERLERMRPQVEALSRFNEISELGEPVRADVPGRFAGLVSSVKTCSAERVSLEAAPYCQACLLALDENVPEREAEALAAGVESAMREYNRRLGSHSVRRVLRRPTGDQLDKLIDLLHVSDLSSLSNVLDAEVIEFLRGFLRRR